MFFFKRNKISLDIEDDQDEEKGKRTENLTALDPHIQNLLPENNDGSFNKENITVSKDELLKNYSKLITYNL
ncbi:hypothetical protein QJU11_09960 [Pasteurella atlantica]|uniref:hypothetical protein n=1 Tax=Phocoenobacter atlanticus TaxID=3416742 RepID=UPI00275ED3B8|nr:hypothetical protein [Pasteurella atlantica]MDP8042515.1 hypothetical protein [Pasteurella atlantica]